MNQLLLVVLLVLVAAVSCGKSPSNRGKPANFAKKVLCKAAFIPTAVELKKLFNANVNCLTSLGLLPIISGYCRSSGDSREDTREGGDDGYSGRGNNNDDDLDFASILEFYGFVANATALRQCIATELGMVQDDGTYDMPALKTLIQGKVAALFIKANTQLGLDNCPAVENFDVVKYLNCVNSYCVTGAAPTTG